jgi:RNA polymerase sigma-70 factor (ECF subfamily)
MRSEVGPEFDSVLAAAQEGAEWAVAVLYRSLQPAVLRYLSARAGEEGEDLAAETWLDVARCLKSFSGNESKFRSWVFTIAHRRLVDHHRRRARRVGTRPDDVALAQVAGPDDPAETALADVAGDCAARRLAELLPAAQAEILLLRVVGDLDADEVARITGRRAGTVRVLQHRALRRLAQVLDSPDELTTETPLPVPRRRGRAGL